MVISALDPGGEDDLVVVNGDTGKQSEEQQLQNVRSPEVSIPFHK